jgi:hypothetical protein
MLSAGFAISGAWFDAGVNGNHIFPIEGPGRFIAEWLMRHAWVPYERV